MANAALYEAMFENALDALIVVDDRGLIVAANAAVETLFGHRPESLIGASIEMLVPQRYGHHAAERARYSAHPSPRAMGRGVILFARHADGHEVPVDISLNPIDVDGRRLVATSIRDLRGRSYAPETIRVQAVALRSAANGVVITDRNGFITWVNPAACRMTGYSSSELIGQHTRILKSGMHDEAFYRGLWSTISGGETWSGTIINRRKDGSHYYEEQTIAPVVDEEGRVAYFIAIKQDVTRQHALQEELREANQELARRVQEIEHLNKLLGELAIRDPLTGLYNRRFFDETFGARPETHAETQPFSVAILDVDLFKEINDEYGHAAGDRTLQVLADVLATHTRSADVICRLGGDEFLVAIKGVTAAGVGERAHSWLREFGSQKLSAQDGRNFSCTLSIGVAQRREGEPLETILQRADEALYSAKQKGRNRVVITE